MMMMTRGGGGGTLDPSVGGRRAGRFARQVPVAGLGPGRD